jgi:hypothetical protein
MSRIDALIVAIRTPSVVLDRAIHLYREPGSGAAWGGALILAGSTGSFR